MCTTDFIIQNPLYTVFCLNCDILCDMCIFVLCLIVVPLSKPPFAVQLNNNNK
jgi:hypothetical protein